MQCANRDCEEVIKKPRLCPGCRARSYCSQQCRLSDWYSGHQLTCGLKEVEKAAKFSLAEFVEEKNEEEKVLGKGSFGEVHLVTHQPTGQKYALKSISKLTLQREGQLAALKREIAIHLNLNSPYIIRLFDHFEDHNKVYLLLELANRGSLFYEIHRKERLSEDTIRRYFHQTCLGIRYLHENDIIHRDLKPENILLDCENNIKICDFGWCARSTETRTTFCGTLDYMAPEMILGGGHTKAIDIWALGVLLFEMTHGRAPFAAHSDSEKCQQILTLSYQTDPNLPPALVDLIRYMLKTTPEDRPTIAAVLSHPWLTSPGSCEVRVGLSARKWVLGNGWKAGTVVRITEGNCWIRFEDEADETCLACELAEKVMLRNEGRLDVREDGGHERNKSFVRAKEDALLRNIDEWCKTPKFGVTKTDFLSELEAASKRLETSLLPAQEDTQKVHWEAESSESRAPDTVLIKDDIAQEDAGWKANSIGFDLQSGMNIPVSTTQEGMGDSTRPFELPCTPMDELFAEEFSPIPLLNIPESRPEVEQIPCKDLPSSGTVSEELSDEVRKEKNEKMRTVSREFEKERDRIDTKVKEFYQRAEQKWITRNSASSIIEAPHDSQPSLIPAKRGSTIVDEIEKLQIETRRPLPELLQPKYKSEDYAHMNRELEVRKQRITELMSNPEFRRSIINRREKPRRSAREESGFFKWLGGILGCTDR